MDEVVTASGDRDYGRAQVGSKDDGEKECVQVEPEAN